MAVLITSKLNLLQAKSPKFIYGHYIADLQITKVQ